MKNLNFFKWKIHFKQSSAKLMKKEQKKNNKTHKNKNRKKSVM